MRDVSLSTRVVVLHGALGSAAQLAPIVAALPAGLDVVVPDLPGHGDRPGRIDLDEMVDDVAAAAAAGAHLLGYSMGGYVALEVARRRPDVVGSVVTVATKLAWSPDVAHAEIARLDPDTIERKVPGFAASLDAAHPGAGWREVVVATAALLAEIGARGSAIPGLESVEVPVRLVVGDRDPLVTVEETLAAARALPAGELQVLPGTGHALERMPIGVLAESVRSTMARAAVDRQTTSAAEGHRERGGRKGRGG